MKFLLPLILMSLSTITIALDCPKAKVEHLQPQTHIILVKQEGQPFRQVGHLDDAGTKAMYSALLAAQMSGKPVIIRYPAGFDCSAYDLSTPATMVRTFTD